jgi:hypothetical protein
MLMTILMLELSNDLYNRLRREAKRRGRPLENVAHDLLDERLASTPLDHLSAREQVREAFRAAGILGELGPAEKERAARSTMTLEEVRAALDKAGGKPLSELILEMRGPKE